MKVFARSLVTRITVSAALVVTTLICVSVAVLVHLGVHQTKGTLATKALLSGRMVADGVSGAVWNLSPEEAAAALDPLRWVDDFAGAVVHGTRGELFFTMPRLDAGALPEDTLLTEIIELRHPDRQGRLRNLGTLRVSFDLRPTMKVIEQEVMFLVSGGVFALLLMVWGTVYVMRGITAPITRMTDVMSNLAAGDIDIVVPNRHRLDEIGRMAQAVRGFQRNAFELREAKECAEKAMLAKAKFLASASHDLRQPVQSLLMLMAVLRAKANTLELRQTVDNLDNVVGVLKDLLDGLLDVSRLDAGSVTAKSEVFDTHALLCTLDSQFGAVARNRGLSFRVDAVRAYVHTDRMLLLRLLGNLIDNAIRYTPSGSVEVACAQAGDTLTIEVRDTGIGIPRGQIEAIWEEFHQVGNSERNRDKGIGLGLAIVRRLSGILRHPVRVRSTHGQGSVFSVSVPLVAPQELPVPQEILPTPNTAPPDAAPLAQTPSASQMSPVAAAPTATVSRSVEMPVAASPAPTADKDAEVAPRRGNRTSACPDAHDAAVWCVLIIEDDSSVRTGLELFLSSHGYRVHAASSGSEGLKLVEEDGIAPDVIISDYNLAAAENGLEVVKRLWSLTGFQIPAMILSGHLESALVREISSLGIKVAQKPLSPSQMFTLIRDLISGSHTHYSLLLASKADRTSTTGACF
jgi:signal transduction histidine kinase/CheY-like chemotaxis protein